MKCVATNVYVYDKYKNEQERFFTFNILVADTIIVVPHFRIATRILAVK